MLTLNGIKRMVADLVKACAARNLVPATTTAHRLRHTFATHHLATHPHDYVGLARLLGHSSLEATKLSIQPTKDELVERVERPALRARTDRMSPPAVGGCHATSRKATVRL